MMPPNKTSTNADNDNAKKDQDMDEKSQKEGKGHSEDANGDDANSDRVPELTSPIYDMVATRAETISGSEPLADFSNTKSEAEIILQLFKLRDKARAMEKVRQKSQEV